MPPTSFERGGVRVIAPASYDVRESPAERSRALPGEPGYSEALTRDALLVSLEQSGLEQVRTLALTPRRSRGLDPGSGSGGGTAAIEVDVAAEQDAVVLLEQDGVYSWHLPTDTGERTRSLEPTSRTAHFRVDLVIPSPGGERGGPGRAQGRRGDRSRGLLGDLVRGAARAIVFRFAAPLLVGKAIETMEQHVRPGLVHLAGVELADWRPIDGVADLGLPTDRAVRVLLLVHGTFSSTVGGFGALGIDPNGRGFLGTAIGSYDAVIGFDHKTLSVDPRANAKDLLERLSAHRSEHPMVIDIITHSRGGLTTRSFVEYELPQSDWNGTVDNIIFVAATNAGTHLADPGRWNDLVDLSTNLAVVGGTALAALPAGAAIGAVVAGVIKGIGAFVKYLVAYSGEHDGVPGLAAMMPEGPFVTEINTRQPGQPEPGGNWYVVSSNFHVELFDDSHHPPEFPRELVTKLKEGFVDQLFKGDNDLVVDTASMSAIGLPDGGGWVRDTLGLESNDVVYHSNYFSQLRVIEALGRWLASPLGLGAGGEEEAAPVRDRELPMAEPPMPQVPVAEPPPPEPPAGATAAKLAAEMPSAVAVAKEVTVRVTLSRKQIASTDGMARDEADIRVDAARPLSVQVVGKSNAEVVGPDSDVFGLPFGGGESELVFRVKALAKGPVAVHAIVRQGWVPLATLRLESTALSAAALGVLDRPTRVEVHTGIDAPELDGMPCIDIIESARPDGSVVYKYAVRIERDAEARVFESLPIFDRARTMAAFLDEVQDVVGADLSESARLRRLQDIGTRLYDLLLPEDMQAYLWRQRNAIGELIVYADEPFVPWELVHLKPPRGARQTKPRFLAQGGLVRWRLGSFPPKELHVRKGRARSLIPDYRDPQFVLSEPVNEERYLAERFGASRVRATPDGVLGLLRGGRFDLLHFSGHGAADVENILGARILLQGRKRGRTVEPQYLSATEVSENARWTHNGQAGPIVVLNACQTGREGILLTTAGGFADAFLDAGAAAFISCLWSVHQQPSRVFVEKLYDELLAGTPMALATARARQCARDQGDATWLAFVVYARPDAVLTRT